MGCFKRLGFYSHLPISKGDDIVLFLLADLTKKCSNDGVPMSVTDSGLVPISLPFFGKYDDYGGIEEVVQDANLAILESRLDWKLDGLCSFLLHSDGMTTDELEEFINKRKSEEPLPTMQLFEKLLETHGILFGYDKYNVSLTFAMEHRRIYDKMVSIGTERVKGMEKTFSNVSVEERFNITRSLIFDLGEELGEYFKGINPLKVGGEGNPHMFLIRSLDDNTPDEVKAKLPKLKERIKPFSSHLTPFLTLGESIFHFTPYDYVLYDYTRGDIQPLKKNIEDYICFLSILGITHTTFSVSPQMGQKVSYDMLVPLYEEMFNFVRELKDAAEKT